MIMLDRDGSLVHNQPKTGLLNRLRRAAHRVRVARRKYRTATRRRMTPRGSPGG